MIDPLTVATRGYLTNNPSCIATRGYVCSNILEAGWKQVHTFILKINTFVGFTLTR